ncbi:MAG: T9SS type A sorting domain-containing protein, partial [Elusimicrobiota bacterium]
KTAAPEDFDLFINTDPQATPQRVDSEIIREANAKLRNALGPSFIPAPQGVVELNMIQEDDQFYDGSLSPFASLSLKYTDADGDGIVDGSNPPIRAHTLHLWRLDQDQRLWVRVPDSSVDAGNKTLSAFIPHFSVYAMIGAADVDVGSVYAYPVPWSPNSGGGNCSGGITFNNVPSEGAIRIYNLAGELVRSQDITSTTGSMCWDVKTNGGRSVSSGVYIWVVQAGSNRKTGKLMIIR